MRSRRANIQTRKKEENRPNTADAHANAHKQRPQLEKRRGPSLAGFLTSCVPILHIIIRSLPCRCPVSLRVTVFFCSRVWFIALRLDCSSPSFPFPIADRCCCTSVCFVVQVCLSYVFCQCTGVPFSLAECSLSALFVVFCFQLCLWPRSDTSETFHQFLQDILHLTTAPVHSQIK